MKFYDPKASASTFRSFLSFFFPSSGSVRGNCHEEIKI